LFICPRAELLVRSPPPERTQLATHAQATASGDIESKTNPPIIGLTAPTSSWRELGGAVCGPGPALTASLPSHPYEPITVLDLCSRMNTSRRTLQYSFENRLGIKPSMYLRVLRLNGAHRELKLGDSATGNVTDVATRWGFWHLARFSMYYRDLFGDYPSETLNRQRRHS